MFRTLIYPSSGDYSVELPHWSYCSWFDGCWVSMWLGWSGIRVAGLFHFLCAQYVSDNNISIIRSLQLFCWITTLIVLFLVRCVLEFRCGWVGVVSVLQAYFTSYVHNMFRTLMYPSSGACDYSVELPHWSYCSWFDVCWSFGGIRDAGFSLQHGYHSNPTTPKLQHTSNQIQYDQCGNSTE